MIKNKKIFSIIIIIITLALGLIVKNQWKHHGYEISAMFDFNRAELKIATPYNNGGACHPKVVYFKNGFNGHKYWMAYTPYPKHNSRYENPCILVSNDLTNWEVPKGMNESCLDDISANTNKKIYNSDTHLLYNQDTKQLECWWRFVNDKEVIIYRRTSRNGIEWEPKVEVKKFLNRFKEDALSPAIIYEDGTYKIWYVFKNKIWYTVTSDLKNFSEPKICNVPIEHKLNPWHLDVEKTKNGYELIYVAYPKNAKNHFHMKLYHSVSQDNIHWSDSKVILTERKYKSWDNGGIYRSCLLFIDGMYHVIYTGWSKNEDVGLGYVSGSDITNLK